MDRAHPDRARGAAARTLPPHARVEPGRNDRRPPTPRAPPLGLRGVGADQDPARARTAGAGGMNAPTAPRLLLVTGLSGAGKSTVLRVLEDLGWEVVDNLPLSLLEPLIEAPVHPRAGNRPTGKAAERG